METPFQRIQQRSQTPWLLNYQPQPGDRLDSEPNHHRLVTLAAQGLQDLGTGPQRHHFPPYPRILLVEPDPLKFLAGFVAACTAQCPLFLGNPHWAAQEWRRVLQGGQPDLIWGDLPQDVEWENLPREHSPTTVQPGWIMIPTGGSSGRIRFAIHTWDTLTASVQGLQDSSLVLPSGQIHSFCTLPLYHVSGLMQFLRSLLTQGHLAIVPYKTLENHWQSLTLSSPPSPAPWLQLDQRQFFLSLVPTQLQRLLNQTGNGTDANPSAPPTLDVISWLRQFHTIFLGGAPAWPSLLHQARGYHLPLAPTYGMTETASQIVTMAPRDFLRGQTGCGEVLPHARVKIDDRPHSQSSPTAPTSPASPTSSTSDDDANGGKIIIAAKSLMLGYYQVDPAQVALLDMEVGTGEGERSFEPDDLGYFAPGGYLHIIGRQSHKIISGGENIFPAEVEAAIQRTGLVADVAVLGLPDPQWGEQVVAVYVVAKGTVTEVTVAEIKRELVSGLARYKWPKQWIAVDEIPRNAQGKINRQAIGDLALGYKTSGS